MASLADVFDALNRLRDERLVENYAIGGATAVLFYAEPTRTFDVDVFVIVAEQDQALVSLGPLYAWARERDWQTEGEHILIHGVPVQFLPAHNRLVVEAVEHARMHDYQGVPIRVMTPEHLIALALQAGGARRRERAWLLLETATVDRSRLRAILADHQIVAEIPDDV